MVIGYARVSSEDQNLDLQVVALKNTESFAYIFELTTYNRTVIT